MGWFALAGALTGLVVAVSPVYDRWRSEAAALVNIVFLIDASAESLTKLEGVPKGQAMRISVGNALRSFSDNDNLGLRAFGGSCDRGSQVLLRLGDGGPPRVEKALQLLKFAGDRNLVKGVADATEDFRDEKRFKGRDNRIVLITGGGDSCLPRDEGLLEIRRRLQSTKVVVDVRVVGFGVSASQRADLKAFAQALGGTAFFADSIDELSRIAVIAAGNSPITAAQPVIVASQAAAAPSTFPSPGPSHSSHSASERVTEHGHKSVPTATSPVVPADTGAAAADAPKLNHVVVRVEELPEELQFSLRYALYRIFGQETIVEVSRGGPLPDTSASSRGIIISLEEPGNDARQGSLTYVATLAKTAVIVVVPAGSPVTTVSAFAGMSPVAIELHHVDLHLGRQLFGRHHLFSTHRSRKPAPDSLRDSSAAGAVLGLRANFGPSLRVVYALPLRLAVYRWGQFEPSEVEALRGAVARLQLDQARSWARAGMVPG